MNKKGSMYFWIIAIVFLAVTSFLYIIFQGAVAQVSGYAEDQGFFNSTENPKAAQTFNLIKAVWAYWPLVIIIGIVIAVIVHAQMKEPRTGYR